MPLKPLHISVALYCQKMERLLLRDGKSGSLIKLYVNKLLAAVVVRQYFLDGLKAVLLGLTRPS